MDSFSAHFNYLLIILFAILVADTHDVVGYEAAPEDYFLSKTSWEKEGTVCSLLCPLLSFSLCSSSTETSERERKIDVPSPHTGKCVCGRAVNFSVRHVFGQGMCTGVELLWFFGVQILCKCKLIHPLPIFPLNHVWISFIGSLCFGRSGDGFSALSFACCPLLQ